MLKTIEGTYHQGKITLDKIPENIPENSKVIVTFLNSSNQVLNNKEIDLIVEKYRQENRLRPHGLAKSEFTTPDDFNEPLEDKILDLFEG